MFDKIIIRKIVHTGGAFAIAENLVWRLMLSVSKFLNRKNGRMQKQPGLDPIKVPRKIFCFLILQKNFLFSPKKFWITAVLKTLSYK